MPNAHAIVTEIRSDIAPSKARAGARQRRGGYAVGAACSRAFSAMLGPHCFGAPELDGEETAVENSDKKRWVAGS